jgi:DNA-binding GntR family transcriptional regulator
MRRIRDAFAQEVGEPLGLSVERAAEAAIRLANVHMTGAIRMVSLSKGHDPRDFVLGFQTSNTQFHQVLLQASGSLRLQALAKSLIELPLVTMKQHNWPGEVKVRRSNEQHREIIAALRARDPLLARLQVQSHIIHARPKAMTEQALAPVALL